MQWPGIEKIATGNCKKGKTVNGFCHFNCSKLPQLNRKEMNWRQTLLLSGLMLTTKW